MADTLLVGKVFKNKGEVRIQFSAYKNSFFLDIREYYEDTDGAMLPTKKGVTVPLASLEDFKEVIALAELPPGFVLPEGNNDQD